LGCAARSFLGWLGSVPGFRIYKGHFQCAAHRRRNLPEFFLRKIIPLHFLVQVRRASTHPPGQLRLRYVSILYQQYPDFLRHPHISKILFSSCCVNKNNCIINKTLDIIYIFIYNYSNETYQQGYFLALPLLAVGPGVN
jgi:hypothetical protein